MTRNEISAQEALTNRRRAETEARKARETERANRKGEELRSREIKQRWDETFMNNISGVLGSGIKALNDKSWYSKDPQAVKDAASLSYDPAIGTPMPKVPGDNMDQVAVAGIMAIPAILTYGADHHTIVASDQDAINVAAKNIYSFVRHANSGSANYDTPDLMEYLIAMDTIISIYAHGVKVLGIMNKYNRYNRYLAKALVNSCGFDFDSLQEHLSDFRLFINNLGSRLGSFNIPATFPLFHRHLWMFSNIWKDSSVRKSQLYHFVPGLGYQFDGVFGTMPAIDLFVTDRGVQKNLTFAQFKTLTNTLINGLLDNEDIGIMSGDILKAYGENQMFKFGSYAADFMIEFAAIDEVLSQIMNADIHNLQVNKADFSITQSGQILQQNAKFSNELVSSGCNGEVSDGDSSDSIHKFLPDQVEHSHILNMFKDDVSPDDNMVASRLCSFLDTNDETPTDRGGWYVGCCGTEVCYTASIYVLNATQDNLCWFLFGKYMPGTELFKAQPNINYVEHYPFAAPLSLLSQFDWFPKYFVINLSNYADVEEGDSIQAQALAFVFELSNYTVQSTRVFMNMHYVALMSELAIQDIGNRVRQKNFSR